MQGWSWRGASFSEKEVLGKMFKPAFITFTGADDKTRPSDLENLNRDFPVEFGILFSKSRACYPRYPSLPWVGQLDGRGLRLAAHICGAWAAEIVAGKQTEIDHLLGAFQRVQVNTGPDVDPAVVKAWADRVGAMLGHPIEPILQCRGDTFPSEVSVSWLFDRSGGRGTVPGGWPLPAVPGVKFGYAGGMSPKNIEGILAAMPEAPEAWIDMESGVRNVADEFDIGLCRRVCEVTYG